MTRFRRNHGGRVKLAPAEVLELPLDRAHVAAIDALAKNSRCGRSTYLPFCGLSSRMASLYRLLKGGRA